MDFDTTFPKPGSVPWRWLVGQLLKLATTNRSEEENTAFATNLAKRLGLITLDAEQAVRWVDSVAKEALQVIQETRGRPEVLKAILKQRYTIRGIPDAF